MSKFKWLVQWKVKDGENSKSVRATMAFQDNLLAATYALILVNNVGIQLTKKS